MTQPRIFQRRMQGRHRAAAPYKASLLEHHGALEVFGSLPLELQAGLPLLAAVGSATLETKTAEDNTTGSHADDEAPPRLQKEFPRKYFREALTLAALPQARALALSGMPLKWPSEALPSSSRPPEAGLATSMKPVKPTPCGDSSITRTRPSSVRARDGATANGGRPSCADDGCPGTSSPQEPVGAPFG